MTIEDEKQQKYLHYNQAKLINMNILQVKKQYYLIKLEQQNKLRLLIVLFEKAFEKQAKIIEDQCGKQRKEIEEHVKSKPKHEIYWTQMIKNQEIKILMSQINNEQKKYGLLIKTLKHKDKIIITLAIDQCITQNKFN